MHMSTCVSKEKKECQSISVKPKWANPQASLLTKPPHSPQGELILEFIVCVAVLIKSGALLAVFQAQETVRQLRISERPELHSQAENHTSQPSSSRARRPHGSILFRKPIENGLFPSGFGTLITRLPHD